MAPPSRLSVDLSAYPELIVVYLGMRVRSFRGALTLARTGRGIVQAVKSQPEGLLTHEFFVFSPVHVAMRQYWRDMESLEAFTRTNPHAAWWSEFLRDPAGTGFWHELYRRQGGMEAIYLDMKPVGFASFAPARKPEGPFASAKQRLG